MSWSSWSDNFDRRMGQNMKDFDDKWNNRHSGSDDFDRRMEQNKKEFDDKWNNRHSNSDSFGSSNFGDKLNNQHSNSDNFGSNSFDSNSDRFGSNSGWSTWPGHSSWPGFIGGCLDPFEYTYIIGIVIQIAFIAIYAAIYFCCFKDKQTVTKMHMFVFYINTSVWGWAIYLFLYKVACGGYDGTNMWITGIVILAIMGGSGWVEMCFSREGGYFRHQKTMAECIQYMTNMKETAPVHRVEIECYHYRTTHHTDSKGRTRTRRRKVVTYREWRNFIYDRWEDKSDYPNLPEISMKTPIVAMESTACVAPGDDFSRMQFDNFRTNFVAQNRSRDWYIDESVKTVVPGHEKNVTAKSEKENEVPCWLNSGLFYFLSIIFCSCPLRVLFRSSSKQHKFVITKLYYVDPHGTNIGNMGQNVTVNIVNNQGVVNINDGSSGTNTGGIGQGQLGFVHPGQQPPPDMQQNSLPGGQQYPPPAAQHYPMAPVQQYPPPAAQNYSMAPVQQYPPPAGQYYPESPGQQYHPPPPQNYVMESKPPSAPAGYQAVPNPANISGDPGTAPSAPPPYNPNM